MILIEIMRRKQKRRGGGVFSNQTSLNMLKKLSDERIRIDMTRVKVIIGEKIIYIRHS